MVTFDLSSLLTQPTHVVSVKYPVNVVKLGGGSVVSVLLLKIVVWGWEERGTGGEGKGGRGGSKNTSGAGGRRH